MMGLESAVGAVSSINYHARQLYDTWLTTMSGGRPAAPPRRLIAESWRRVQRHGVDPDGAHEILFAAEEQIEKERQTSRLGQVIDVLRGGLTQVADDGLHIMVITNPQGSLLWREGANKVRLQAEAMGFSEGARWDESSVGTNGIGTGLAVERPIQIIGAEHFARTHHPWVCSAAPLRDPVDDRLLGLVDVSGPIHTAHPSTLALVDSVTRLARATLREAHDTVLMKLRTVAAPVLAKIGAPAMVTDRHGWVAAAVGVWPGRRVMLPESDEGETVTVPSMGRCRIEPLFDGWLIRPEPAGEPDRPTTLLLHLGEQPPALTVRTPSGGWRHRLSPRHAEILLLLALSPGGRSAAELSQDLYGNREHTVTIRAEMSRLRRHLGDLIEQRPYRLPEWLRVSYELPEDPARLLPQSTAPAMRALRSGPAAGG